MASSIINVLVNNPWPPTFIKGNTTLQKLRINEIQSRIKSYNDENRWNVHQDIYTVFLQGIPYMIEKNIERHWKEMFHNFYKEEDFVTDKSWPPNCNNANEKRDKSGSEKRYNPNINYDPSMKNFEILLPLENDQGQVHVCNFNEFFKAIQIGNVTPDQLFVRPVPDPNNKSTETISLKKQPKKRSLRTTKPIDYKEDEGEEVQESDGERNEDKHLAEKPEADDDPDTKPPAKRRKTTPRKTKAVVQVKLEEKVQLEIDIAKTIKTFDTAIDKFKKEIDYDEDKSEKSTLEEQISNILTCWKLMKMQVESYKKAD